MGRLQPSPCPHLPHTPPKPCPSGGLPRRPLPIPPPPAPARPTPTGQTPPQPSLNPWVLSLRSDATCPALAPVAPNSPRGGPRLGSISCCCPELHLYFPLPLCCDSFFTQIVSFTCQGGRGPGREDGEPQQAGSGGGEQEPSEERSAWRSKSRGRSGSTFPGRTPLPSSQGLKAVFAPH